jgi:hypothetical protein
MVARVIGIGVIVGAMIAPVAVRATASADPGRCPSDSKLLNGGPTLVFGEGPGTWWGLVTEGLLAAGFDDEAEQIAYLNGVFGTSFTTLAALKDFNLQQVDQVWDENRNGAVCAYELRGTRKYFGDPFINLTAFGISDDRIGRSH